MGSGASSKAKKLEAGEEAGKLLEAGGQPDDNNVADAATGGPDRFSEGSGDASNELPGHPHTPDDLSDDNNVTDAANGGPDKFSEGSGDASNELPGHPHMPDDPHGDRSTDVGDALDSQFPDEESYTNQWPPSEQGSGSASGSQASVRDDGYLDRTMPLPRGSPRPTRTSQDDCFSTGPRRVRRTSLLQAEHDLALHVADPFKELVQYQLFCRPDPFQYLTNAWAQGGEKGEDMEEEENLRDTPLGGRAPKDDDSDAPETANEQTAREEREATGAVKKSARDAEVLRMRELLNDKGGGWKLWLRGRDLRSEFVVQPEDSDEEARGKKVPAFQASNEKREPIRKVSGKSWIRAPVDARHPEGEKVCWRIDFARQALDDANLLGLERPMIAADKFRELARKDWDILQMFYYHVEAVDLDGHRELWSPTFVGFLWEYWQRSKLGPHVCISEEDLEARAQSEGLSGLVGGLARANSEHEGGLFQRKTVKWPKPVYKPPSLKVPSKFYKYVDQPDLPPLPGRFQTNLFYEDSAVEESLSQALRGTEGWDAMIGTSDRLQAAARSVLRSEKFADAAQQFKADVLAKRIL